MPASKHVVFATFGSLGDVHPFFAIGHRLKAMGHRVTLATSEYHRAKIEAEGFGFRPVRPDIAEFGGPSGLFRAFSEGPSGPIKVLRRHILPRLRATSADLFEAARDADFLGAHPIFYPAPLVAEKLGIPWAATILQPMAMLSASDPSMFRLLPAAARRAVFGMGRIVTGPLVRPVRELRRDLGLPANGGHPMFGAQFSPFLNLALFSPLLALPQPDWPAATVATGFPFFDGGLSEEEGLPGELRRFLDSGPAPLVFTLGSTAVDLSVRFYLDSFEAAKALGCRAVFLAGKEALGMLPRPLPPQMLALRYAPHGPLFPRASAVIHSGGIGTTAQALRSGQPQLIVPFGFDQPDNALRVAKLGAGLVVAHRIYTASRAVRSLRGLLGDAGAALRAAEIGRIIRAEDGAGVAAGAIEALLGAK